MRTRDGSGGERMAAAYPDSNIVIPLVEARGERRVRFADRLVRLLGANASYVVSDPVRTECKVKPFASGDERLVFEVDRFLASPRSVCVSLPSATFDRAAGIRTRSRASLADALHLAAAMEAKCDLFVTADRRLTTFTGIPVVLLRPDEPE
jgi:predicted nucleic acid-binding protein